MGDQPADIAQLVAEHHRTVYGYAYRLTGSVADAEDLTQHVFLVAQQKLGQLRTAESARSWLFTILRRRFLKTQEHRPPIPASSLPLNLQTIAAEIPHERAIEPQRLQEAMNELPPDFRVVLVMFYFEECSYRQIAEKLDMPIGTVMSRLARAKGHLRAKLSDVDGSEASRLPREKEAVRPRQPSAAR